MRVALVLLIASVLSARGADELWGPVDVAHCEDISCVSGRRATEEDVKQGRACFYIAGGDVRPLDISLPHCAIWHDQKSGAYIPVICIQAEVNQKIQAVGFRSLKGGNGACLLSELTLLDAPDERFIR